MSGRLSAMTWRRRRRALWRLQPRPTADASPTLALNQTRWRPPHPQPQLSVTTAGTDSAGGYTTLCLIAAPGYAPPSLLEKVDSRSMPPTEAPNHGIQTARGRPRRIARGGENPGAATASICPRAARRARAQQPRAVGTPPLDPRQQPRSQLPPGGIGCLDPREWCHRLQAWMGGRRGVYPRHRHSGGGARRRRSRRWHRPGGWRSRSFGRPWNWQQPCGPRQRCR